MTLTPTPLTAAIAGVLAAVAWPMAHRALGADGGIGFGLLAATLLLVALPAHALVVGFGHRPATDGRSVDRALLRRVGAWVVGAGAATALQALTTA